MNKGSRVAIVLAVIAALAIVLFVKERPSREGPSAAQSAVETQSVPGQASSVPASSTPPPAAAARLPKLVDLGGSWCVPCKMMAPILDELKTGYAGRLDVEVIDVGQRPEAGRGYGIRVIPTQVFIDASGREVFRHEGFMSKEDILLKWKELGVDLGLGG